MDSIMVKQVKQFLAVISNTPGALASLTEALAGAGVNLEGFSQIVHRNDTTGSVRFVTNDEDAARKVLSASGMTFTEEPLLAFYCSDRPGVIAAVARALGDAKINIMDVIATAPGGAKETVFYVGVREQDFAKAMEVAKGL
jgi:hypothetical protein